MTDYLMSVPAAHCIGLGEHPEFLEMLNQNCKCRCGYEFKNDLHMCSAILNYDTIPDEPSKPFVGSGINVERSGAGLNSTKTTTIESNSKICNGSNVKYGLWILLILLFAFLFIVFFKCFRNKSANSFNFNDSDNHYYDNEKFNEFNFRNDFNQNGVEMN